MMLFEREESLSAMRYISALILVLYGLVLLLFPHKIQKCAVDLNDSVWGKFFFFRAWHVSDGYIYWLRLVGAAAFVLGMVMNYFAFRANQHSSP